MRKLLVTLLTIAIALSFGTAVADESDPDCEDSQRAADGDTTTGDADKISDRWNQIENALGQDAGHVCEGEHYEGADSTGVGESCGGGGLDTVLLDPNGRIDQVAVCYNAGPTKDKPDLQNNGPTDAVHLRVAGQGSPGWKDGNYNVNEGAVFAGVEIWGVGAVRLSGEGAQRVAPCVASGTTPCSPNTDVENGIGAATLGVYLEDHSDQAAEFAGIDDEYGGAYNAAHQAAGFGSHSNGPEGNLLASIVHFPHITLGQDVGEEDTDCTQDAYVGGSCKRDNTAASVELLA